MLVALIVGVCVVAVAVLLLALPGGLTAFGRSADLGPKGDLPDGLLAEDDFRKPTDERDLL
jgi:hypothetical protein